jgi:hypothetical protein
MSEEYINLRVASDAPQHVRVIAADNDLPLAVARTALQRGVEQGTIQEPFPGWFQATPEPAPQPGQDAAAEAITEPPRMPVYQRVGRSIHTLNHGYAKLFKNLNRSAMRSSRGPLVVFTIFLLVMSGLFLGVLYLVQLTVYCLLYIVTRPFGGKRVCLK